MPTQRYKPGGTSMVAWRMTTPARPAAVFHRTAIRGRNTLIQSPAAIYGDGMGLGFSLNPFKIIGSVVKGAIGPIKKGSVSVPGVPGDVPLKDIPGIVRGSTITIGPKQPSPIEQAVDAVPGGMTTLAVVGIGALALIMLSRRR